MKLFMFAGLRHHDVEPWPLYTSHRDILQPCVGTVHVSIWGWLEMRPNASRPPRREKTRSVWSNRNSFIWNETFAEPQDKGEQDSFHLKAPIKIQHIHSSAELPVMASTCWGDLWGCSEGIAEETINWKVRGAPSDSDNWRVHDRIPGNAHSPVWCLVGAGESAQSWTSLREDGRPGATRAWEQPILQSSLWKTRSWINARVLTVSTQPALGALARPRLRMEWRSSANQAASDCFITGPFIDLVATNWWTEAVDKST